MARPSRHRNPVQLPEGVDRARISYACATGSCHRCRNRVAVAPGKASKDYAFIPCAHRCHDPDAEPADAPSQAPAPAPAPAAPVPSPFQPLWLTEEESAARLGKDA